MTKPILNVNASHLYRGFSSKVNLTNFLYFSTSLIPTQFTLLFNDSSYTEGEIFFSESGKSVLLVKSYITAARTVIPEHLWEVQFKNETDVISLKIIVRLI